MTIVSVCINGVAAIGSFHCLLRSSHLGDGLQPEDAEALLENLCGGVAEHDAPHVDLDDVAGRVLLDAVARVVELGEGRGHLVHELAQGVLRRRGFQQSKPRLGIGKLRGHLCNLKSSGILKKTQKPKAYDKI